MSHVRLRVGGQVQPLGNHHPPLPKKVKPSRSQRCCRLLVCCSHCRTDLTDYPLLVAEFQQCQKLCAHVAAVSKTHAARSASSAAQLTSALAVGMLDKEQLFAAIPRFYNLASDGESATSDGEPAIWACNVHGYGPALLHSSSESGDVVVHCMQCTRQPNNCKHCIQLRADVMEPGDGALPRVAAQQQGRARQQAGQPQQAQEGEAQEDDGSKFSMAAHA